jgi:hypothetical protein
LRRILLFVIAFTAATAAAQSWEGMFMPQQVPQLAESLRQQGLQLDPAQFTDLTGFPMGAVVSTGGCSASFVSPKGLIVTNHHCVFGSLQYNSTPQRDLITNGFLAKTMAEEIQATPDSRIYVTTQIQDVTRDMVGNLSAKLPDAERYRTIDRRRKDMVAACEKPGGLRCQVAEFFEGSQYLRITQMEIRDVRLVYAPAEAVGNFGGDIDNWMWPRHTGDFGFYRAYVGQDGKTAEYSKDNVPYQPKHWLRVSAADLDPGDLAIVAGYPGVTHLYETAAEVKFAQERFLPAAIRYRRDLIALLEEAGKQDRETTIRNASRVGSFANYMKKYEGTLTDFRRGDLLGRREREEQMIRQRLASNPAALSEFNRLMSDLDALLEREAGTYERDNALYWFLQSSPMLNQANKLYRLSVERAKKDIDRARDYQERDWARLKANITRTQRTIDAKSDRAGLRYLLQQAANLPANQRIGPVDEALARTGEQEVDRQIDAFLDHLYANTKIADLEARQQMFGETNAQLMARNDAMIQFAAGLRRIDEQNERRDEVIKGAMSRLRPRYFAALREVRGGVLAPDANATLRLSFGVVRGYAPRDGVQYEPFTTVEGVVEKETGESPFNSPPELLAAARAEQFGPYADPELGTLPVDFLSTGVVTNGSSGSATLNARGELIGLAFDGNYEAMGSDYVINPELTRTIHVDSRYMLWMMDRLDRAHNLLREMDLPVHFPN